MSDPVSNAEIEDVLSSIRRLVSEHNIQPNGQDAAAPSGQPSEEAPEAAAPEHAKFVLTPAFRVHEEVAEDVVEEPIVVPSFLSRAHDEQTAPQPQPDVQPEAENEDVSAEGDAAEPLVLDTAEHAVATPAEDEDSSALEDRIAELEAAFGDSENDLEPDEGEASETQVSEALLRRVEDQDVADDQPDSMSESIVAEAWEDIAAPIEAVQEKVSEAIIELAVEGDDQDADAVDARSDEAPFEEEISNPFEGLAEEDVLDEEMLRELVSRLVREELQGAVGEKITRSVRRLVRREIERALTLKEFE